MSINTSSGILRPIEWGKKIYDFFAGNNEDNTPSGGRVSISGLKGLSAKERENWENEKLSTIADWKDWSETEKDWYYRDELFKNFMMKPSIKEEAIPENADEETLNLYNKQLLEEKDKMEYYKSLSPEERDRIFADEMFEKEFGNSDSWETIKNLHPKVRDELYNNPRYFASYEEHPELNTGVIKDPNEDYRNWAEKLVEGTTRGLSKLSTILTPNYAKEDAGGLFGMADFLRGGKKGAVVGSMYGAVLSPSPFWGSWIGGLVGGYGISNAPKDLQKHNKDIIEDSAHAASNLAIKSEVGDNTDNYIQLALMNLGEDPNWYTTLDSGWDDMTKDNPLWQTFKNTEYALLTDGQKIRLVSLTQAIADKYGIDAAMQILNDDINDIISEGQGLSFLRSLEGAGLKLAASKGEKLLMLANKIGYADELIQHMPGVEAPDYWRALRYMDNVDKLGILNVRDQEDIIYGTNTLAYKDFVTKYIAENGSSEQSARDAWIEQQEATGDYKGYGISPHKKVRATGNKYTWFSIDSALDAFEMSGYFADLATAQWLLGKLTKGGGRVIGAQSRKINNFLLRKAGTSAENRAAIQGALTDIFTKAGGYGRAYYGSIPISVGYGMAAYDEVRQTGLDKILKQINNEIDSSPEYLAQLLDINNRYELLSQNVTTLEEAVQLQQNKDDELRILRESWVEQKKLEKAEDFSKLDDEAHDAYNMNFILESLRNTGINLSYRAWLYKDASRAVHGGRIPLDLPNFERTLGRIGFNDLGKKIDKRILSNKFGKNFRLYVTDEEGNLVRNTSEWRATAETAYLVGKNMGGGFWSNYMDDASVGFSAGFNLHDFNDYMQVKYDPDTYKDTADLMSSFLAGATSGAERMLDEQSFLDGFIGALGSVVSANPIGAVKLITGLHNFTHDALGNKLSLTQIMAQLTGNPILLTMSMVLEERKNTDDRNNKLNKIISDNGVKVLDVHQLLHWADNRKDNHDFGDYLDMKDANDGLGFAILYNLAKLEEEGGNYGQVALGYFEDLKRIAKGGDNITMEDITAFLGAPENRHLLNEHVHTNENGEVVQMDDEGRKLYAQMLLLANAQKMLDLNKKLRKNLGSIRKAFQNYDINDDTAVQLAFSLTMRDQWETRLEGLNKKLTDIKDYSTDVNDDVEYRSRKFSEDRLEDIKKKIEFVEKQILQHLADIDLLQGTSIKRSLKAASETKGSLKEKYRTYKQQRIAALPLEERIAGTNEKLNRAKEALKGRKKELASLKEIQKRVSSLIKERDKGPEVVTDLEELVHLDLSIHDVKALNKQLIMSLNPQQRANIILYPETFGAEQLKIVKELIEEEERKNPDFKIDIRDAATLYNRIQENNKTINSVMASRESFNKYAVTMAIKSMVNNKLRYFNSDEYKALERNSLTRRELVSYMPAEDNNQRSIVNSVINYLQNTVSKGKELDLTNIADVLQLFDANKEGILKVLNEDKNVALNTPSGTIDMVNSTEDNTSVRDLVQKAVEANAENLRVINERQEEVSVPEETTSAKERGEAAQEETAKEELPLELAGKKYKVSQKAIDEGKLGVDTIVKYLNGEKIPSMQLSFLDPLSIEGQLQGEEDAAYAKRLAQEYIDKGYIELDTSQEPSILPTEPTGNTDRYLINPEVKFTKKMVQDKLNTVYLGPLDDDAVNTDQLKKLKLAADYLNGKLTYELYLKELGIGNKEAAKDLADREADKYKQFLIDTLEGNKKEPITSAKPEQPKSKKQLAEEVDEIINGIAEEEQIADIFAEEAEIGKSSIILFNHPYFYSENKLYTADLRKGMSAIGANMDRIVELLEELMKKKPKERKKIYYAVPKALYDYVKDSMKDKYLEESNMPVVALIEDEKGKYIIGNNVHYTPIGLAPSTSKTNPEAHSVSGQTKMEPIRKAAIKENVVLTDTLLKTEDGKPIQSSLINIKRVTPPSMTKGMFRSVMDILLSKIGYNETLAPTKAIIDDIFSRIDTAKDTSMYKETRKRFLSALEFWKKLGENLIDPKEKGALEDGDNKLVFPYKYQNKRRPLMIFTLPFLKTKVVLGEKEITIAEAILQGEVALLNKESNSGSRMLQILASEINYELSTYLNSKSENANKVDISTKGEVKHAKEFSEALNNAFKKVFYGDYKIVVNKKAKEVENAQSGLNEYWIEIAVNYSPNKTDEQSVIATIPKDTVRIEDDEMLGIIKRFLFTGDNGMGEFRGISDTGKIQGLGWNIHNKDLVQYQSAVANTEHSKNAKIVEIAHALFDDGIISLSQESIPGVVPYLSSPFDTKGNIVTTITPQVDNGNNAGTLEGNTGHLEEGITEVKPMTEVQKESINDIINKILKYSREQREKIKLRREAASKAAKEVKNHLSATTIAGMLYDSTYSEDSPYYHPSTMIGTDVDSFIREFFKTDNEGNFIFDKNAIDYSLYSTLSKEVLDEMVNGLEVLKNLMTSRGETRIISEEVIADGNIKVTLTNGEVIEVPNTGHLDMMTVDNMGKIHVYDFKTFRDEDNFQEKVFKDYAVQLNVYKNLLEKQYGVKVDSVHIIPITVSYPSPSNSIKYSEKNGNLILEDEDRNTVEQFKLEDPTTTRLGITVDINLLKMEAKSGSLQAELMLKALGFTKAEIELLKSGNIDNALTKRIQALGTSICLNIPMLNEVTINMDSLSDALKTKLNAVLELIQKEKGKQNPAQVSSMKVDAPPPSGITIKSELLTDTKLVPDAAAPYVGLETPIDSNLTPSLKKEEINDTLGCRPGLVVKGRARRMIT